MKRKGPARDYGIDDDSKPSSAKTSSSHEGSDFDSHDDVIISKKRRKLDDDDSDSSDDSMIGESKKPWCARRVSEHIEFEDKASNENDISSDREPSANSRVDVDALNGKQDGNYEQNVDAPKGHDYSNSELELIFGNVSIYIIFKT